MLSHIRTKKKAQHCSVGIQRNLSVAKNVHLKIENKHVLKILHKVTNHAAFLVNNLFVASVKGQCLASLASFWAFHTHFEIKWISHSLTSHNILALANFTRFFKSA